MSSPDVAANFQRFLDVQVPPEEEAEAEAGTVDWSASGLALPVGSEPAVSPFNKGIRAFGRIAAPSRGKRDAPYGSSELEDGLAAAQQAEQLLASTSAHLGQPETPGGATVKLEGASA